MEEDLRKQKNSVGHTSGQEPSCSGLFYICSITFAFKDFVILIYPGFIQVNHSAMMGFFFELACRS